MEVAQKSLFLAISMSTAVFNITKAKDASGREIDPIHESLPGLIRWANVVLILLSIPIRSHWSSSLAWWCSFPKPFQCSITPRSEKAATLIRTVLDEHPFEKGDSDIFKELWYWLFYSLHDYRWFVERSLCHASLSRPGITAILKIVRRLAPLQYESCMHVVLLYRYRLFRLHGLMSVLQIVHSLRYSLGCGMVMTNDSY